MQTNIFVSLDAANDAHCALTVYNLLKAVERDNVRLQVLPPRIGADGREWDAYYTFNVRAEGPVYLGTAKTWTPRDPYLTPTSNAGAGAVSNATLVNLSDAEITPVEEEVGGDVLTPLTDVQKLCEYNSVLKFKSSCKLIFSSP